MTHGEGKTKSIETDQTLHWTDKDFKVAIIKIFKVKDMFEELRESITLMTEETRSHSR